MSVSKSLVRQKATKQKLDKAVELWREARGHVTNVCQALGVNRSTFYRWLAKYPKFAQALQNAEAELNDDLRNVLIDKAAAGKTSELLFYLKNRHPDFKQQRLTGFKASVGNEKIEVVISDY